jgi:hypothetical protein
MLLHKRACVGKSAATLLQMSVPQRPCVNHVRSDLQSHRDIGCTGQIRKPSGVIEQRLIGTDLN